MMRKLLLSFLVATSFVRPLLAAEIRGQVFLEDKNGKAPLAGATVRIHVYKDDYEFSGAETLTNALGYYKFSNLMADERHAYIIYPIYKGINYPYEEIVFDKLSREERNFTIQETTGSVKDISVSESIYFEQGQKDMWKITHEITLLNHGEFLYHPDRPDTEPLKFSLFSGGFDLAYVEGITRDNSDIDDKNDVLSVFLTLAPKDPVTIKFSYYYIPEKRRVEFDRTAFLRRSNSTLYFGKNIRLSSRQFQLDPMLSKVQDKFKYAYTSGPIEQGAPIQFVVQGFFMQRDFLHIILFLSMMLFVLLLVLLITKIRGFKKESGKVLTEQMHRYLIDLKKKKKAGLITEKEFNHESNRIINFLFQTDRK